MVNYPRFILHTLPKVNLTYSCINRLNCYTETDKPIDCYLSGVYSNTSYTPVTITRIFHYLQFYLLLDLTNNNN